MIHKERHMFKRIIKGVVVYSLLFSLKILLMGVRLMKRLLTVVLTLIITGSAVSKPLYKLDDRCRQENIDTIAIYMCYNSAVLLKDRGIPVEACNELPDSIVQNLVMLNVLPTPAFITPCINACKAYYYSGLKKEELNKLITGAMKQVNCEISDDLKQMMGIK
jgi:hypothetical protein